MFDVTPLSPSVSSPVWRRQASKVARLLCTDIWPTLYSLLPLRDGYPFAIWRLPKEEAIALTAEDDPVGREIRAFYQSAHSYFGQEEHTTEGALQVIEQGVIFLQAAEL